jgi:hypothetical protein
VSIALFASYAHSVPAVSIDGWSYCCGGNDTLTPTYRSDFFVAGATVSY